MIKNEPARSRAQVGHTQEQAAAVLGVSWRTWQNWEIGVNEMPAYALRLYRHLMGLERIPFRALGTTGTTTTRRSA